MKKAITIASLFMHVLAETSMEVIVPIAIVSSVCIVLGGIFLLWIVHYFMKKYQQFRRVQQVKAKLNNKVYTQPFPIKMEQPTQTSEQIIQGKSEDCIICLQPVHKKQIILKPCGHSQLHQKCFKQWVTSAQLLSLRDKCCICTVKIKSYSKVISPNFFVRNIIQRNTKQRANQVVVDL